MKVNKETKKLLEECGIDEESFEEVVKATKEALQKTETYGKALKLIWENCNLNAKEIMLCAFFIGRNSGAQDILTDTIEQLFGKVVVQDAK